MKRKFIIAFILALLALSFAGTVGADTSKKKHKKHRRTAAQANDSTAAPEKLTRKEERKKHRADRKKQKQERRQERHREKHEAVTNEHKQNQPAGNKPTAFKYPATVMKPRYRIDVLASMYLDELVKSGSATFKDKIPDKALPGVSFYEGISIAADTLKKAGFNIDIYIHDIASASESPEMLISKGIIDSADLIIGAAPAKDVLILADYAKKKKINFISALSPSDGGVKGNKYFTMLQPTLKSHCDWIVDDITKKFPGMKVSLLFRTATEADNNAYLDITSDVRINFRQYLCNTLPGKQELAAIFDTTRPNIIIVPVLDAAYADSLLKELSRDFPATHFEVYGMPTWGSIADLRKDDAFPNLSINVTTSFSADNSSPATRYLLHSYKDAYGGKASEYIFHGYEAMFWFADLLKKYGTFFNLNYNDNSAAPFTRFDVKPQWDNEGHILYNENRHILLSKYEGGLYRTE